LAKSPVEIRDETLKEDLSSHGEEKLEDNLTMVVSGIHELNVSAENPQLHFSRQFSTGHTSGHNRSPQPYAEQFQMKLHASAYESLNKEDVARQLRFTGEGRATQ
jgi:hypothetical protein